MEVYSLINSRLNLCFSKKRALGFDEDKLKQTLGLTELTGGENNYHILRKSVLDQH
jgi:hypothetical protein